MANDVDSSELLCFEAPQPGEAPPWAPAEKAALKSSERLLEQARELNECRKDLNRVWADRERVTGLVVRNLITVVDNCKTALPASTAASESAEAAALASAHRIVLHLLEELGAIRIDLLGHTYEDVVVDGDKVEDPFEILESDQKGKSSEVKVREVVNDLWISRAGGATRVLRRGTVNC